MKRNILAIATMLWATATFSQEVISELSWNPQLYKYQKSGYDIARKTDSNSVLFTYVDTLSLPFIDDFSHYHLKAYEQPVFVFNKSIKLTDTILEFHYMDSVNVTWRYVYDPLLQTSDTLLNEMIHLILNDDSTNLVKPTDTISGFPPFMIFDTIGNEKPDTVFLTADSVFLYSRFFVIRDTSALWLDNYVFINDNYPTNKLSYGVATFDGLNEYGLPYNDTVITAYGPADTLTSKPINLDGLGNANVYLSFAYQPQGLGYRPETEDSLILECKLIGNTWQQMWAMPGSDSIIADPVFKNVLIAIDNPFFFSTDFQFRFRNKATISGNNDHWHLDYVHLDRNRTAADTIIRDISVLSPATSFLKNYVSMPWNHFELYETVETENLINLTFRNNNDIVQPLNDIRYSAVETNNGNVIYQYPPGRAFNLSAYSNLSDPFSTSDFIPYSPSNRDSVVIDIVTSFSENPTIAVTLENNVVSSPVLFHNYFAYDDGSAEKAYGLEPHGLLKFAYEFNLNHPDTLRAIEFHFAQITQNLSAFDFTLMVWGAIDSNGTGIEEDTLYARPGTPLHYNSVRNGFVVYRLDPPLVIQDRFYIGWQQLFSENMQVGLDLNNSATEHMFYYSSGTWKRSQINGAVMMRPIVGKYVPIIGTGVESPPVVARDLIVYPNPADDILYIIAAAPVDRIEIYDLQGRTVKTLLTSTAAIDISDLRNGLYCLRVSTNGRTQVKKFAKQ